MGDTPFEIFDSDGKYKTQQHKTNAKISNKHETAIKKHRQPREQQQIHITIENTKRRSIAQLER